MEEAVLVLSSRESWRMGAVAACVGMTVAYVGILHSPTVLLRLPPPETFNQLMIRRFVCALISTLLSLLLSSLILLSSSLNYPNERSSISSKVVQAYGIQSEHIWEALLYPTLLTTLMYAGSITLKALLFWDSYTIYLHQRDAASASIMTSKIAAWRNLVVAPLTEELVFRASMIPLLLCSGFQPTTVIFICPLFFSLAHLNHFFEFYARNNRSLQSALLPLATQLAYTLVFGTYASFLFIRTGHLIAPLAAHIVCNFMGLPVVYSKRGVVVSLAFTAGTVGFVLLLGPLTVPALYNGRVDKCFCWHGYCTWK